MQIGRTDPIQAIIGQEPKAAANAKLESVNLWAWPFLPIERPIDAC
jgi:hypothetical protein